MELFSKSAIAQRKNRAAAKLNLVIQNDDLVVVSCGEPIQKPGGLDQTYDFIPHPDYFWLTGFRRPAGVSIYTKNDGWVDFVNPVSTDEKIWEGAHADLPGQDVAGLTQWIAKNKFQRIIVLGLSSTAVASLGKCDAEFRLQVQEAFNQARRIKDGEEVALIKKIAVMAHAGYKSIENFIRPGVTERQIQVEFESAVLKAGAEKFPYGTIVGTGTNSAVLHAVPTSRVVKAGDLVLIDGGADVDDYCVDITRVYSADGKRTGRQKDIYDIVLRAQENAIAASKAGTQWTAVHRVAAQVTAEGLKDLGLMNGSIDGLLDSGAISVFFPHGVGHMVGLRVRDVGGKATQKVPGTSCGARLRVDLPLEENFVMTVEPGLYFIPALLDNPEIRLKYKNEINWNEIENWRDIGGVRIEDDILITNGAPENLTQMVEK